MYQWIDSNYLNLQMTFKTYLVDIAMKAGSFLVDKLDESKYKEIRKQWYNNQSIASHAALVR